MSIDTAPIAALTQEIVNLQDQLMALGELGRLGVREHDLATIGLASAQAVLRATKVEMAIIHLVKAPAGPLELIVPAGGLQVALLADAYALLTDNTQHLLSNQSSRSYPHPPGVDSILMLPVHIRGDRVGFLALINKDGGEFRSADVKLSALMVRQTQSHFENWLAYQDGLQQLRLESELALAHDVQTNLKPTVLPSLPGLEIWAASKSARQVGGDYYDFVANGTEKLRFSVGDISGKGVAAAMLMTMTRTAIRTAAQFSPAATPAAIVQKANAVLFDDYTDVGMFATLLAGEYLPQSRQLTIANCGHAPVIYCPAGGQAQMLVADGTPLGVLEESLATDIRLTLGPGDIFIVATDGLTEAENGTGEMLGYDRLLEIVTYAASLQTADIASAIMRLVSSFSATDNRLDDQTLLILKGTI